MRSRRRSTQEVGKPLAQAKNELNGFLGRIDFFLAEVEQTIAPETVVRRRADEASGSSTIRSA